MNTLGQIHKGLRLVSAQYQRQWRKMNTSNEMMTSKQILSNKDQNRMFSMITVFLICLLRIAPYLLHFYCQLPQMNGMQV